MIRLDEDEKIIFVARKHWFIFFTDIVSVAVLLLLPFIVIGFLSYLDLHNIPIPGNIFILAMFFSSITLLFLWVAIFVIWTDFYLDILILTNKHIIDVDQKGLFSRELSTLKLDKIQDVTTEVNGVIASLLKFGTIQIQTAGEDRDFIIRGISKPFDIRHIISQQQELSEDERKEFRLSSNSIEKLKSFQK